MEAQTRCQAGAQPRHNPTRRFLSHRADFGDNLKLPGPRQ